MNLFLIGYRGSGKTTVAKQLAVRLDWQWLDTDDLIVEHSGQSIAEIFEQGGESRFRELEFEIIKQVVVRANLVVSLGGGAITNPDLPPLIAESGKCIWLRADPEVLFKRLGSGNTNDAQRPALTNLDGLTEIKQVLAQRQTVYEACADYSIDTDELTPEQVVDQIAQWLASVDNYF